MRKTYDIVLVFILMVSILFIGEKIRNPRAYASPLPTPSAHTEALHVKATEYALTIEFATATGALAETVRIQRKEGRLVITTEPAPEEGDKLTGRLRSKDENSRFKEVFFPGYNYDSKPSEGQCPFCGGKVTSEITGCPEGKIGCTVAHFGLMCSKCGRILERLPEGLTGTLTPGEAKEHTVDPNWRGVRR
jgi:hypothetical protein